MVPFNKKNRSLISEFWALNTCQRKEGKEKGETEEEETLVLVLKDSVPGW